MEANKHPDILYSGFIRPDDDDTFTVVLQIAGINNREVALKIGLEMSSSVDKVLTKTFGKFRKFDTLTKGFT